MNDFGVTRAPRSIIFGLGQRGALGRAGSQLSRAALVCTDARLGAEPVFAAMMDDLKNHGLAVRVYDRTVAELPLSCVDGPCEMAATRRPGSPSCAARSWQVLLSAPPARRPRMRFSIRSARSLIRRTARVWRSSCPT